MRTRDGFTLTELLVAMGVSLIVSLAGWTFFRTQLHSLSDQAADLEAAEAARAALGFLTRELRLTGLDPDEALFGGGGALDVAEASRIQFRFDRDGSGSIDPNASDPNAEVVLYSHDAAGERIRRTVAGNVQTLIPKVPSGGLSLRYFDRDGNELPLTGTPPALSASDRDDVALVLVTIQVTAATERPRTVVLSSRAALRNRVLDRL